MGLNSSGPISLGGSTVGQSVNLELGNAATAQISLGQSTVRSLAGVPSGAISLDNLHGKSSTFSFNLTSGSNLNLRTQALAAGWNGTSAVIATIPSGNTIQSASTGSYSLTIDGSFPSGVTLINNGEIIGRGGNGGTGASTNGSTGNANGGPGSPAGPALFVSIAVSINNVGAIRGGGGGGGGGASAANKGGGGAGGGGGGGIGVSTGGSKGSGGVGTPKNGTNGTLTAIGTGGAGGTNAGAGGNGGSYGSAGSGGGSSLNGNSGGGGGAAGACLAGNSNITWIATGTRNGAIT